MPFQHSRDTPLGKYQRQEKHRKCSSSNSGASEETTDHVAILRKHGSHLPDRASLFAGSSQKTTFSELAVPTLARLQGGCSEAALLLRAGSATTFSHKLFLSLLLLPPCTGDSKAPKPSQPFSFQHRSICQQPAQSKQICPRCLFVLLLVPSLPSLEGFPAVPVSWE